MYITTSEVGQYILLLIYYCGYQIDVRWRLAITEVFLAVVQE